MNVRYRKMKLVLVNYMYALALLLLSGSGAYAENIELEYLRTYSFEINHSLGALLFIIRFSHHLVGFILILFGLMLFLRMIGVLPQTRKFGLIAPIIMTVFGLFWGSFNVLHHGVSVKEMSDTIQWTLTYLDIGMFTVMYLLLFIGGVAEIMVARGSENRPIAMIFPALLIVVSLLFITNVDETPMFISVHMLIGVSLIIASASRMYHLYSNAENSRARYLWPLGLLVAGVLCFVYSALHAMHVL